MRRAALITCHNIKNYGSVFQTYATTVIFKEFGYEVTVIDYQRPDTDNEGFRKKILEESHLARKFGLKHIFPLVLNPSFSKMERVFSGFLKKNIDLTGKRYLTEDALKQDCPEAELYISGSDQIWNSDINGRIEKPYYLSFVPDNKNKISFASSFGKTKLREDEKDENRRLLKRYKWLTTREESGAEIIKDLGINAEPVLDPTLWLSKAQWEELAEPIKKPGNYILVYQLHQNSNMDQYVKKIEKVYGMPCFRIDLYYHYMIKAGKHVICPTPGQVISLVKNADCIISDSFHMTVFSIIFNKRFVSIYSENSFNDRIANILRWLNLEDRHLCSYEDFSPLGRSIDYTLVNSTLQEKVAEMYRMLEHNMKLLK